MRLAILRLANITKVALASPSKAFWIGSYAVRSNSALNPSARANLVVASSLVRPFSINWEISVVKGDTTVELASA